MVKRLLDVTARELAEYTKEDKLAAIRGSDGRIIAAEIIASAMPAVLDVSNPELASSQGADMIVINDFDVNAPSVRGIPGHEQEVVREIKRLTGRLIAISLEPVDRGAKMILHGAPMEAKPGRLATAENAARAAELGVDAIMLTGNPGMGVTNSSLRRVISTINEAAGDGVIVIAGKMHSAGSTDGGGEIVDSQTIAAFAVAGADIILLPAPGTVPGCHESQVRAWVESAHSAGALTMTAIGTSQEGADLQTIRSLALMAKMTGTDIHHIGDCGYFGITVPENILAYSIAIRGRRHAYRRMAMSLVR